MRIKQITTVFIALLLGLMISSCEKEDFSLFEEQERIAFAEQLAEECLTNLCPEEVLCHYQNGLYHYMIFLWEGNYYSFGWIEGIEGSYYYDNEPMDFESANQICKNL